MVNYHMGLLCAPLMPVGVYLSILCWPTRTGTVSKSARNCRNQVATISTRNCRNQLACADFKLREGGLHDTYTISCGAEPMVYE